MKKIIEKILLVQHSLVICEDSQSTGLVDELIQSATHQSH